MASDHAQTTMRKQGHGRSKPVPLARSTREAPRQSMDVRSVSGRQDHQISTANVEGDKSNVSNASNATAANGASVNAKTHHKSDTQKANRSGLSTKNIVNDSRGDTEVNAYSENAGSTPISDVSSDTGFERSGTTRSFPDFSAEGASAGLILDNSNLLSPFKTPSGYGEHCFEPPQSAQPIWEHNTIADNRQKRKADEGEPSDDEFELDEAVFYQLGFEDAQSAGSNPAANGHRTAPAKFSASSSEWSRIAARGSTPSVPVIHEDLPFEEEALAKQFTTCRESQTSSTLKEISPNVVERNATRPQTSNAYEDVTNAEASSKGSSRQSRSLSSSATIIQTSGEVLQAQELPKLQWLPPKFHSSKASPRTPPRQAKKSPNQSANRLSPFVRPPFPKAVLVDSPILGLTHETALRTCFRVGEALNAATAATHTDTDVFIELYARVNSSDRDTNGGCKQRFEFWDLFTDKPPHLHGTFNLWKDTAQWDIDSKAFLGTTGRGRMCRAVGKVVRRQDDGGKGPTKWEMLIFNIFEVGWEDVEVAKGVLVDQK